MNIIANYLNQTNTNKHQLSKNSGIPYTTVCDIVTEKTPLNRCCADTIYKLSCATGISCDNIIASACEKNYTLEQFRSSFWDVDIKDLDFEKNKDFIIARLYVTGGTKGILYVHQTFSDEEIVHAAKTVRDLNPIVANYLRHKYNIVRDDMAYYRMEDAGGRELWDH